jgi:hypothetical protein
MQRRFFRHDDLESENVVIAEADAIVVQIFKLELDIALLQERDVGVTVVTYNQPDCNGVVPKL